MDVRFNEKTGGLLAVHREHSFDPTVGKFGIPRGDYEKNSAKVLSAYGMNVILGSETSERGIKTPDGLLNGMFFDIKGIEGKSNRIIKDKILEASIQGAETVVLYFHDASMFDKEFVAKSYGRYLGASKNARIKKVYCIVGKYLHKI
jgi:hypothetical protein